MRNWPIHPSILANTLTGTFRQLTLASAISCASIQTTHCLMNPLRSLSRCNNGHQTRGKAQGYKRLDKTLMDGALEVFRGFDYGTARITRSLTVPRQII